MLYHLFLYLDKELDISGTGVFQFITFRAGMAVLTSLLIALFFGKYFIVRLQKNQIGESVRDLGLEGQIEKQGTPTMGGLIILICIIVPTILFARPENVYVLLLLVSTIWMGAMGFLDDYIKVFKKNKEGLQGKFKVVGQVGLGLIVGLTLYYNSNVTVREYHQRIENKKTHRVIEVTEFNETTANYVDEKSSLTTIPFMKNNELDYNKLTEWLGFDVTPFLYVLIVIFIITAVSNGANITDGIDGLTAGTSAIIGATLLILAYVSGHAVFADYLNIMYIPNSGEIVIFTAAFVGACLGFLWFNSFPAQVFMGDTGSLSIGGIIAVIALSIRKELLIPILCGIFLIENISVILQVSYFKYTKKKYGEGRRIFKMAPLHHHYQKDNMHEAKIVTRFWLVGIILSILTLATLKLR